MNQHAATEKVETEMKLGRWAGPFNERPISNLRCSPIGVILKSLVDIDYTFIYPPSNSVNDFIDEKFTKVNYSPFGKANLLSKNWVKER